MAEEMNITANELEVDPKSLLGQWRKKAYDQQADKGRLKRFWEE